MANKPLTIHPQGVAYGKKSEGAKYTDSTLPYEKLDDSVMPGQMYTYIWEITEEIGPKEYDPACLTNIYYSHENMVQDFNSGLIGALLICKKGSLNEVGEQRHFDKEYVLMFAVFDENKSWQNLNDKEHSVMYSINGYVNGTIPDIYACAGDSVSWHLLGMSSEPEFFSIHFFGQTLEENQHKVSVVGLVASSSTTANMTIYQTGKWLITSLVEKHFEAGMHGYIEVQPCSDKGYTAPKLSLLQKRFIKVWEYFIAAEEEEWNYVPSKVENTDKINCQQKYKKVLYKAYSDNTFTKLLTAGNEGLLGPVIRAQVRDTITVVFKNKAKRPYSIYPHGVSVQKAYEGASYPPDIRGNETQNQAVMPGETVTYYWNILETDEPAARDPRCLTRMYHSAVNITKDIASGLIGPLLICKSMSLNTRGVQEKADLEQIATFALFDENKSWYHNENKLKHCHAVNNDQTEYYSHNIIPTINGYAFESAPLGFCHSQVIHWHISSVGAQDEIIGVHLSGHTLRYKGKSEDTVNIFPMSGESISVDMDNLGLWLFGVFGSSKKNQGLKVRFTDVICVEEEEDYEEPNIQFGISSEEITKKIVTSPETDYSEEEDVNTNLDIDYTDNLADLFHIRSFRNKTETQEEGVNLTALAIEHTYGRQNESMGDFSKLEVSEEYDIVPIEDNENSNFNPTSASKADKLTKDGLPKTPQYMQSKDEDTLENTLSEESNMAQKNVTVYNPLDSEKEQFIIMEGNLTTDKNRDLSYDSYFNEADKNIYSEEDKAKMITEQNTSNLLAESKPQLSNTEKSHFIKEDLSHSINKTFYYLVTTYDNDTQNSETQHNEFMALKVAEKIIDTHQKVPRQEEKMTEISDHVTTVENNTLDITKHDFPLREDLFNATDSKEYNPQVADIKEKKLVKRSIEHMTESPTYSPLNVDHFLETENEKSHSSDNKDIMDDFSTNQGLDSNDTFNDFIKNQTSESNYNTDNISKNQTVASSDITDDFSKNGTTKNLLSSTNITSGIKELHSSKNNDLTDYLDHDKTPEKLIPYFNDSNLNLLPNRTSHSLEESKLPNGNSNNYGNQTAATRDIDSPETKSDTEFRELFGQQIFEGIMQVIFYQKEVNETNMEQHLVTEENSTESVQNESHTLFNNKTQEEQNAKKPTKRYFQVRPIRYRTSSNETRMLTRRKKRLGNVNGSLSNDTGNDGVFSPRGMRPQIIIGLPGLDEGDYVELNVDEIDEDVHIKKVEYEELYKTEAQEYTNPDKIIQQYLRSLKGKKRKYYITAEEEQWDYYNPAKSSLTKERPDSETRTTQYTKVRFRQYLDSSFSKPDVQGEYEEHLGILGPVIRAEVDDIIQITFKNLASRPYSLHAHGVSYEKSSEGFQYDDGTPDWLKKDDAVKPGETYTYVWYATHQSAPENEGSDCRTWIYYSGVNPEKDIHSGLLGPLLICKSGTLHKHSNRPLDVREFVLLFMTFEEEKSWYFEKNKKKTCLEVMEKPLQAAKCHTFHAINGKIYNLKGLVMYQNESVRWHMINMGGSKDLHVVHFHGQTVTERINRESQRGVYPLLPGSFATVEMKPSKPGHWLLDTEVAEYQQAGMQAMFHIVEAECNLPMGLSNGIISDNQITASHYIDYWEPRLARLNNAGSYNAWSTVMNMSALPWIQVDLQRPFLITGIKTQGASKYLKPYYVKEFFVVYSLDKKNWIAFKGNSITLQMFFDGNTDAHSIKENTLDPPISAQYIRVYPTKYYNRPTLRMELFGCEILGCFMPLGMENGIIKDEQITASSYKSSWYSSWVPSLARLNKVGKSNAWQAKSNNNQQWLQIDFLMTKRITGITTQGAKALTTDMYVKSYSIQYSDNGKDWKPYTDELAPLEKVFLGNANSYGLVKNEIRSPILARFLRIIPKSWHNSITLRIEIFGCNI
ncbi:hypothetical protein XENTR_v10005442 [Xenopus tropicalis]|nr:hypothetical protein XENTR_v10005442 [Xenopus tropicalis]